MGKKLITQEDIEELLKDNNKNLSIPKDTIITAAAMDLIRKKGVMLDYNNNIYENKTTLNNIKENSGIDSYGITKKAYDLKDFPSDLLSQFYYLMLKIRLFEELVKTYREKEIIPGVFVHSYIGQEAVAVGVCSNLSEKDYLTSTHRGHGHLIAKGADISKMLAEMLGKADGYCKGKGGSMHITDIGIGILGANGIVGAGLPIACGSALASKFNGDNSVTVSFFGDGASNQGTFGESLNFAKIFSLPVIFLCENNSYAVSTPILYGCGSTDIYKRAAGYGITTDLINGDDVFEVYSVCKAHIEDIRKNPHPVLIEAKTHRHLGHWVGDPQKYRSNEEMANMLKYDPLRLFLDKIKNRSEVTSYELEEIEKKLLSEIKEASEFAKNSPYPLLNEATKDYLKE